MLLSLLAGCVSTSPIVKTVVVTETKTLPVTTMTVVKVVDPISGNEYTIKNGEVGVANADARVTGYYPGYAAHWNGLVLNGENTENQFAISVTPYISPDYPDSPAAVANWVTIDSPNLADGKLFVPAMSVGTLYITLDVPGGIQLPHEWGLVVHVVTISGDTLLPDNAIRMIVVMQQPQ